MSLAEKRQKNTARYVTSLGGVFLSEMLIRGIPKTFSYDCSRCSRVCCSSVSERDEDKGAFGYNYFPIQEYNQLKQYRPEIAALSYQVTDGLVCVRRLPSGCIFYRERSCEIHQKYGWEKKPIGCRIYPLCFIDFGELTLCYYCVCNGIDLLGTSGRKVSEQEIRRLYDEWVAKGRPPTGHIYLLRAYNLAHRRQRNLPQRILNLYEAFQQLEAQPPRSLRDYLTVLGGMLRFGSKLEILRYMDTLEEELGRLMHTMLNMPMPDGPPHDPQQYVTEIGALCYARAFSPQLLYHKPANQFRLIAGYALGIYAVARILAARHADLPRAALVREAEAFFAAASPFSRATRRYTPLCHELGRLQSEQANALNRT